MGVSAAAAKEGVFVFLLRAGEAFGRKQRTMIVEGHGMGFWTGVRFPSNPDRQVHQLSMYLFFLWKADWNSRELFTPTPACLEHGDFLRTSC